MRFFVSNLGFIYGPDDGDKKAKHLAYVALNWLLPKTFGNRVN